MDFEERITGDIKKPRNEIKKETEIETKEITVKPPDEEFDIFRRRPILGNRMLVPTRDSEPEEEPEPTTLWGRIERELTTIHARGYALAIHLGYDHNFERTDYDTSGYIGTLTGTHYSWNNEIEDDGNTTPSEFDGELGYLVCTETEANELARDYIIETAWAFTASFLSQTTTLPATVFEALCGDEERNEAVLSVIRNTCGVTYFVQEAISGDGRGHFLSQYDGNEAEVQVGDITYYIYQTN